MRIEVAVPPRPERTGKVLPGPHGALLRVLLLVAWIGLGTPPASGAPWSTFVDSEAGFSIRLPGEPTRENREASVAYSLHTRNVSYLVVRADYPPEVAQMCPPRDILEAELEDIATRLTATVVARKDVSLGSIPGLEARLDLTRGVGALASVYVAGERVYVVVSAAPAALLNSGDVTTPHRTFRVRGVSNAGVPNVSPADGHLAVVFEVLVTAVQPSFHRAWEAGP
ncbi:MAG: hypothetical protein AB1758_01000 [Candidatus Eremiobacterota bacterium]